MPLGENILSAFQVGQGLGQGQSALGHLVKQVVERFGQQQQLQGEYALKLGVEKAKMQFDPEARARQEAFQSVDQSTQDPAQRIALFQQRGLLPRPTKSLEEIFAESQAKGGGYRAGAPKLLSGKQEDAVEGIQTTLATLGEMERFMEENPDIDTGLLNPSMRRDFLGNVSRSLADPRQTSFSQMSFRLQDAYRRFVTGVQAGFAEVSQFLPSSIPNPSTQTKEQLRAGIATLRAETLRATEQMKRAMRTRGYSEEDIAQRFAALPTLAELTPSANVFTGAASEARLPAGGIKGGEDVKARLRAKYGQR